MTYIVLININSEKERRNSDFDTKKDSSELKINKEWREDI